MPLTSGEDDPLLFHARYVVWILPWDEEVQILQLVAFGRLAVGVKKTPVIAAVPRRACQPVYLTFTWQGTS